MNIMYMNEYDIYIYIYIYIYISLIVYTSRCVRVTSICARNISLRGSSVKIGTMQRRLAWPLRKYIYIYIYIYILI